MGIPVYPAVLTPAHWDKQKGVLSKPNGIGDGLKALKRLYDSVDASLFDAGKAKTAAELEARVAQLDAEIKKKIKSLSDDAKTLAAIGKKWEGEYKKASVNPKEASAAAALMAKAADEFADDLQKAAQSAQAELATRLGQRQSEDKASAAKPDAESPNHKLVRAKVIAGLKTVRAAQADAAPVMFMVCLGKLRCSVYLGASVGGSHKTLLTSLMDGDSGLRFFQGRCVWEKMAYTFVGDDVPSGLAKKLQQGLLELTAQRCKVRVRKSSGEVEEAEGDADEAEAPVAPTSTPPAATTPFADVAKAFNNRLAALMPKIKASLAAGGSAASGLKLKVAEAGASAAQKNFDRAKVLLDEVEQLIASLAVEAEFRAGWRPAAQAWQTASDAVDAQIAKLQKALRDDDDEDMQAVGQFGLNGVTGNFKVPLMTAMRDLDAATGEALRLAGVRARKVVTGFRNHLDTDEGVAVCDDNPYDIPVGIRATLGAALSKMDQALAPIAT